MSLEALREFERERDLVLQRSPCCFCGRACGDHDLQTLIDHLELSAPQVWTQRERDEVELGFDGAACEDSHDAYAGLGRRYDVYDDEGPCVITMESPYDAKVNTVFSLSRSFPTRTFRIIDVITHQTARAFRGGQEIDIASFRKE